MRRALTSTAVLALLLSTMVLVARPAAAGGNGAQTGGSGTTDVHDCELSGAYLLCTDARGEYHYVYTPSGDINLQHNLDYSCLTAYDAATGAIVYQDCARDVHFQFRIRQGEIVLWHESLADNLTFPDGSTCSFASQYHMVNGVVQYDRFTSTCV